jgi:hypothetical protein
VKISQRTTSDAGAGLEPADVEGNVEVRLPAPDLRQDIDPLGVEKMSEIGANDSRHGVAQWLCPAVELGKFEPIGALPDNDLRPIEVLGQRDGADPDAYPVARGCHWLYLRDR